MRVHLLKVFVSFRWGHTEKLHAVAVQQHFQFVSLVQAFDLLVSIAREADLDVILIVAWKRVGQQGATARAEHEGAPPEQIERLRTALCGPLGSVGDRLVWAGWLPFTAGLAVAGVALGLGWPAVLGFLVVYNAGHVALRSWALRQGWLRGLKVAAALQAPWLQRAGRLAGPGMALGTGVCLPLAAVWLAGAFEPWARIALAAFAATGLLLLRALPGHVSGLRLGLGLVAVALVAGWVWP